MQRMKINTVKHLSSKNSKTSKLHTLALKRTNKLDLIIGEKDIPLSNLSIYYT